MIMLCFSFENELTTSLFFGELCGLLAAPSIRKTNKPMVPMGPGAGQN